jgi:hypothetical protein
LKPSLGPDGCGLEKEAAMTAARTSERPHDDATEHSAAPARTDGETERDGKGLANEMKKIATKIGCASNVALDHFQKSDDA